MKPYSKVIVMRVSDGEGGFTRDEQSTRTVYLNVSVHAPNVTAICNVKTDLTVKDIVIIDGGEYEVLAVKQQDGSQTKTLTLERKDKPIEPVQGGNPS
jgi:hypothetical protein